MRILEDDLPKLIYLSASCSYRFFISRSHFINATYTLAIYRYICLPVIHFFFDKV